MSPPMALPAFQDCCLSRLPNNENIATAYQLLLDLEAQAPALQNEDEVVEDHKGLLLSTRILGQLLISFGEFCDIFGSAPLARVAQSIMSQSDTVPLAGPRSASSTFTPPSSSSSIGEKNYMQYAKTVEELGTFYRENFLRVLRQRGPSPQPSHPPSRPSAKFGSLKALTDAYLRVEESGLDSSLLAVRKLALVRDGFRCVLSDLYDEESAKSSAELMALVKSDLRGVAHLECCHILPVPGSASSGKQDRDDIVKRVSDSTRVLAAVLETFGLGDLAREFAARNVTVNGVQTHSLANMLTLCPNAHEAFISMSFWFEPTAIEHHYRLADRPLVLRACNREPGDVVVFRNHDYSHSAASASGNKRPASTLPMPDARLLALHATCARVAHMSGAAEYFDRWEAEGERGPVLCADGSSAEVLAERLGRLIGVCDSGR